MKRYLLDTNIISEATRPVPSEGLVRWLAEQDDASLFMAALSLGEIRRGILEKAAGRKRRVLEAWFAGPDGPQALFAGRILAFDEAAALVWAGLMADGTAAGQPRSAIDMMLAAIAEVSGCLIVTANVRQFAPAVQVLNPLEPDKRG